MRSVTDIPGVQKVLKQLLDWQTLLTTKNWDFHQLRITNAGDAVDDRDYVTLEQLKAAKTTLDDITKVINSNRDSQFYTIVFSANGVVLDGDVTPGFIVGTGREGIPTQVWVCCEGAPTGDLTINVSITYISPIDSSAAVALSILTLPLHLLSGTVIRTFSSTFIDPLPKFGNGAKINGMVVTGSGASDVSIGVVVKRII